MCRTTRGNVLFLILLAIALFGALTYAVTSSMRGGKTDGTESAYGMANDILSYAGMVENEASRLIIENDLDPLQVDFYNVLSHYTAGGTFGAVKGRNPNCTALSVPCAVFSDAGGAIQPRDFQKASYMKLFVTSGHPSPGEAQFFNHYITNVGTPASDVVMYVHDLKKEVCDAINDQLKLPRADTQPAPNYYGGYAGERFYWQGAGSTYATSPLPGPATAYLNQKTFCVRLHGYSFVHVLLAR